MQFPDRGRKRKLWENGLVESPLRNAVPRQGTETTLQGKTARPLLLPLRNAVPRQGTETNLYRPLDIV